MATALDIGLVGYFGVIFPILLVFVVSYAILSKSKFFGENNGLYALISFALSMMLLFSPDVVKIISVMAPWFVLLFIFFILAMITLQFMGVEGSAITEYMTGSWNAIHWIVLAIVGIILIGSLGVVFGDSLLPYTDGDQTGSGIDSDFDTNKGNFNTNVAATIFHPKVIGLIFLFLIGAAAVRMLSEG